MPFRALVASLMCCQCCAGSVPLHEYHPDLARQFAALASVTFCHGAAMEHVLDWTCRTCAEARTPLTPGRIRLVDAGWDNATRVLVGKLLDQPGCLLAFRGSDDVENWLRDFQAWSVYPTRFQDCDGCQVHAGFYKIWNNIREAVLSALREVGCHEAGPDNLLHITGHSMGAALTHLAMFALDGVGFNISKSYSFEAPRVGNDKFAEAFDQRFRRRFPVFRITHAQDPVVHLPPLLFGYHHVQAEVWYDRNGDWTICEGAENRTCADRYWDIPVLVTGHWLDHCESNLLSTRSICYPDCSKASDYVVV